MKLIAIIEVPDDMYDDYQDWYITSNDDLELRYEEDGAYMHLKNLGDELKLKPLPQKKEVESYIRPYYPLDTAEDRRKLMLYIKNRSWNDCIDKILKEGVEDEQK